MMILSEGYNSVIGSANDKMKCPEIPEIVKDRIIQKFVEAETTRRVEATEKVLRMIGDRSKELNKINRPDVETYNKDGSVATQTYSKERLKAIKDISDYVEKLDKALEDAFERNDFSAIFRVADC